MTHFLLSCLQFILSTTLSHQVENAALINVEGVNFQQMLFPFPIKKQCPLVTVGHSWKDPRTPAANLAPMDGAERVGWSLPCQQGQHSPAGLLADISGTQQRSSNCKSSHVRAQIPLTPQSVLRTFNRAPPNGNLVSPMSLVSQNRLIKTNPSDSVTTK